MRPVTLACLRWSGELPRPGQFLKAPRGRTAFEIVQVIPVRPGAAAVARFRCVRHDPAEVPPAAFDTKAKDADFQLVRAIDVLKYGSVRAVPKLQVATATATKAPVMPPRAEKSAVQR